MKEIHSLISVRTAVDVSLSLVSLWLIVVSYNWSQPSTPIYNGVGPYAMRFNPIVLNRTLGAFPLRHPGVMMNCATDLAYAGFRCVRPSLVQSPLTSLHSFRIATPNSQITWAALVPAQSTRECMSISGCNNTVLFDANMACAQWFNTSLSTIVAANATYLCTTGIPNITYANPFTCAAVTTASVAACVVTTTTTTTTTTAPPTNFSTTTTTTTTTTTLAPSEARVCVVFGLVVPGATAIAPTQLTEIWGTASLRNTSTVHTIQIENPYFGSSTTPANITLPNLATISLYAVIRSRIIIVDTLFPSPNATVPDMTTATVSNSTTISYWVFRSLLTCDTSLRWTTPLCANAAFNISYSSFTFGVTTGPGTPWDCPPAATNYVFTARPAFTLRTAATRVVTVSVRDNLGNALTENMNARTSIPCSGQGSATTWVKLGPLTAINWTDASIRHNNATTAILWMHDPFTLRANYGTSSSGLSRSAFSCTFGGGYSMQSDCSMCYGGADYDSANGGSYDTPVLDFQPWSKLLPLLNAQQSDRWRLTDSSVNLPFQGCWLPGDYLYMYGSGDTRMSNFTPGDAFAKRNNGTVLLSPSGTLWGQFTTQCSSPAVQVRLAYVDTSSQNINDLTAASRLAQGLCHRVLLFPNETQLETTDSSQNEPGSYGLGCTFLGTATLPFTAPVADTVFAPVSDDSGTSFIDKTFAYTNNYNLCTNPNAAPNPQGQSADSLQWVRRLAIPRAWDEFRLRNVAIGRPNVNFPRNFAACDNRANMFVVNTGFGTSIVRQWFGNGFAYVNVAVAPFPRVTAQVLPLPTDYGAVQIVVAVLSG